jgi:hypothetical protein
VVKAADTAFLVRELRKRKDGTVLFICDSMTLPEVIRQLGGPVLPADAGGFDNLFVLTITGGETSCLHLHYGQRAYAVTSGGKGSLMEIDFVRSGGLAGMLTQVEGKVVFNGSSAQVNSPSSGYTRKLDPQEIATLQSAAESAARQQTTGGPGALRDAYQYEIHITANDGKTYHVTEHGESAGTPTSALAEWVRQECERIWEYRTQK